MWKKKIEKVFKKREVEIDSLQSIQLKILDLDTNLEMSSELNSLQYLSGLMGMGWIESSTG